MTEQPPIQTTPVGALRFNNTTAQLEYFDGNEFVNITTDSVQQNAGTTRGLSFSNRVSDPNTVNTIDLVNIDTTGDAVDFGDLAGDLGSQTGYGGQSNGHGGLSG